MTRSKKASACPVATASPTANETRGFARECLARHVEEYGRRIDPDELRRADVLHDELRRCPVPAANLEDPSPCRQSNLRHVAGADGLHGRLRCADIQRLGDGVQHLARLLSDAECTVIGHSIDVMPPSGCAQFQRSRYLSSRPAMAKISSTTTMISKISANISAEL